MLFARYAHAQAAQQLRAYATADSRWREAIDTLHSDLLRTDPEKARLLHGLYLQPLQPAGRQRGVHSDTALCARLCVTTRTLYNWRAQIISELALRAVAQGLICPQETPHDRR